MASIEPSANDALPPYRGLGACWIVYGVLRLGMAVWLVTLTREATVMFGALLVEVANSAGLMADFHAFYLLMIILSVLCGVIGVAAGIAPVTGNARGSNSWDHSGIFVAVRAAHRHYPRSLYSVDAASL